MGIEARIEEGNTQILEDTWILGSRLFDKYYAVFDMSTQNVTMSNRIGLALKNDKSLPDPADQESMSAFGRYKFIVYGILILSSILILILFFMGCCCSYNILKGQSSQSMKMYSTKNDLRKRSTLNLFFKKTPKGSFTSTDYDYRLSPTGTLINASEYTT